MADPLRFAGVGVCSDAGGFESKTEKGAVSRKKRKAASGSGLVKKGGALTKRELYGLYVRGFAVQFHECSSLERVPSPLIEWAASYGAGASALMIDRFDVRALLPTEDLLRCGDDESTLIKNPGIAPFNDCTAVEAAFISPDTLDLERFSDLPRNTEGRDDYNSAPLHVTNPAGAIARSCYESEDSDVGETSVDAGSFSLVAYDYPQHNNVDAAVLASETAPAPTERNIVTQFRVLPIPVGMLMPTSLTEYRIIEATARRAAAAPQLEVMLRVRQAGAAMFSFLEPGAALAPLYDHLRTRAAVNEADWPAPVEEAPCGAAVALPPAAATQLPALLSGYGTDDESDDSVHEEDAALSAVEAVQGDAVAAPTETIQSAETSVAASAVSKLTSVTGSSGGVRSSSILDGLTEASAATALAALRHLAGAVAVAAGDNKPAAPTAAAPLRGRYREQRRSRSRSRSRDRPAERARQRD